MMLLLGILFLSIIGSSLQCGCNPNKLINADIASYIVTNPTSDGSISGTPCAANCSTTITLNGTIGLFPAGARLSIISDSFSFDSSLYIFGGDNSIQNYTSPQNGPIITLDVLYSNILKFQFQYTKAISTKIIITPIEQLPTTTSTMPPPTTPLYTKYKYNPGLNIIDLSIAIDTSLDNPFIQESKDFVTSFAKDFNFDGYHGRLSLYSFDPSNLLGYGTSFPWTINNANLSTSLDSLIPYLSGKPMFYQGLNQWIFNNVNKYPYRNNTQRVLIYLSNQDVADADNLIDPVKNLINENNLKIIFVNMDSNKTVGIENFDLLLRLNDTATLGSNSLVTYTYQGDNDTFSFMNDVFQNGAKQCNLPISDSPISIGSDTKFSVPRTPASTYCNYIDIVQKYSADASKTLLLAFTGGYEMNYNYDSVMVYADDKLVYKFTGNGFDTYLCLNATNTYSIGVKTQGDYVYSGFRATLTLTNTYKDCRKGPQSSGGSYQKHKFISV